MQGDFGNVIIGLCLDFELDRIREFHSRLPKRDLEAIEMKDIASVSIAGRKKDGDNEYEDKYRSPLFHPAILSLINSNARSSRSSRISNQ